jgi:hypothetical protein
LRKHQGYWSFGRTTFDATFPTSERKHGGGAPREYSREDILIEAAVAAYEDGLPDPLTLQGWADKVRDRLGAQSPGDTLLKEILAPLHRRFKAIVGKD